MRYLPLLLLFSLPVLAQPDTADAPHYPPTHAYYTLLAQADSLKQAKRTIASQSITIRGLASGETKRQENTGLITGAVIVGIIVGIVLTIAKQ